MKSKKRDKVKREKFTTTLDPKIKKRLEIIKAKDDFSGVNEVIEYLAKSYKIGGRIYEDKDIKRKSDAK